MKKISKKFLLELKKMSHDERVKKCIETGNMLYALDADKCLKEGYGE